MTVGDGVLFGFCVGSVLVEYELNFDCYGSWNVYWMTYFLCFIFFVFIFVPCGLESSVSGSRPSVSVFSVSVNVDIGIFKDRGICVWCYLSWYGICRCY